MSNSTNIFTGFIIISTIILIICFLVVFFSLWTIDTSKSYDEESNKIRVTNAVNSSKAIGWVVLIILIILLITSIIKFTQK